MWMQQMSTQLTSVAEELVRITADKHKLHGADMPEPMDLETGPPKPRGPPPPPGAAVSAAPLAAPLAAPPFYAGASSSAAPVTVAGAPINISIRNERSPDQRTAKVMRIDTPSPERRAKEAAARAEQTAARAEESARKATIDAEVAATRARDAQEREAKAAARARSLENKLQRAEERERAREAKSAERKATEAREAEARAEAKRAREVERAKSAERKAEAKRVEAARAEARAEAKLAEAEAKRRVAAGEARERSRTPGGGIPAPPVHVPTDSVDSRELRASTPDLTPEQEALLALVKQKYGIPDDMSIAEIVEASRRMLAMQAAKKPRSKSGARSSTA
jgi:chemotaxis protein histidine kinase CheA